MKHGRTGHQNVLTTVFFISHLEKFSWVQQGYRVQRCQDKLGRENASILRSAKSSGALSDGDTLAFGCKLSFQGDCYYRWTEPNLQGATHKTS